MGLGNDYYCDECIVVVDDISLLTWYCSNMNHHEFDHNNEWDKIRQSIYHYVNHVKSITTLREWIIMIYDIVCLISSTIVRYCCSNNNNTGSTTGHNDHDVRFRSQTRSDLIFNHIATTYTAFYMYTIIAASMLTHQLWILHGISIYLFVTIASYVIKWLIYILDDPELITNYKFLRGWAYVLIHEGEDILNGDAAWKLASAYLMVQQAPTGMSYVRYIIRYKTRLLRKQFLMELGGNRYGGAIGFRISALKNKLAASLQRSVSSDSGDADMNRNQMFNDDGEGYYEEIWHNDKNDVELVLQQKKRKWR